MADDASIYVFHADTEGLNFRKAFSDAGFYLSGTCIWKKQSLVLGRSPYQWQHEPCLFGWKKNGKHQWYSDRKQTTIWEFDKPKKNGDHPTMKPVPLIAYPIKNSSMSNCIVLDPFGGSGSTLIACEQTNRICHTIELDEKYCDVIVKRYIEQVGTTENVSVIRAGKTIKFDDLEVPADGECGEMFRRIHWNNHGCKSIVWRCLSRLEPTGQECHARTVNETVLEQVVLQAINALLGNQSTYQAQLQQNIAKVIREAQKTTADSIDTQLAELQKELLKRANNKEAYDEIAEQIFKLREQKEQCTVDTTARDEQIRRITELQDFIQRQPTALNTFDEALVKRWLSRIIVWDDHFTVELKSGLSIEIEG